MLGETFFYPTWYVSANVVDITRKERFLSYLEVNYHKKVKITICDSDQTVYFSNTYGNFQFLKSCFINLLHKTLSEPIFIVTVMVASYSGLKDCLYRIKKQKIVPDFLKCHEGRVSTNENMKLIHQNKLDKNRFQ